MDDPKSQVKIKSRSSVYKPSDLNDLVVENLAEHGYSYEEIGVLYGGVDKNTISALHGDAFRRGNQDARMMPRQLMRKMIKTYHEEWPNVKAKDAVSILSLYWRKYEDLGKVDPVQVQIQDSPLANLSNEELEAQFLEIARSKGWTPPA